MPNPFIDKAQQQEIRRRQRAQMAKHVRELEKLAARIDDNDKETKTRIVKRLQEAREGARAYA